MRAYLLGAIATLVFFAVSASAAFAGDDNLYEKEPSANSAFIRVVHGKEGAGALHPRFKGKPFNEIKYGEFSPYVVIPFGETKVTLGEVDTKVTTVAKGYYTGILKNGTLTITEDPAPKDPLKAQVIFYNFTDAADVSLKTADGKTSVLGPVAAGDKAGREVNPIKVTFAIYAGDKKLADVEGKTLERDQSYAIALMGSADKPTVTFYKAVVSTR